MAKLTDFKKVSLSIVLVSLLCGCTNPASQAQPGSRAHSRAQALNQAEKYRNLAGKEHTDKAMNYRLRAAEQMVAAGEPEQAILLMDQNNKRRLSTENAAYKHLILAQIALDRRDPKAAQEQLSNIWTPLQLPEYLKVRFYSARSNAFLLAGNDVEAVQERIFLAKHIKSAAEQNTNYQAIWQILEQASPSALQRMQRGNPRDAYNGWLALALIDKQYSSDNPDKSQALAQWKETFPDHPAIAFMQAPEQMPAQRFIAQETAPSRTVKKADPYRGKNINTPRKVALLLPLQGNNAKAAQAVRDGFLAAYYSQTDGPNKPTIQVYDTTQGHIADVYQAAVSEGAEFVVGPLFKEEVDALNNSTRPNVPILTLNMSNDQNRHENMFQFGLSPELEAQAVADRAWLDGHRNALIITPKSSWGQRMNNAFTKRWEELGGVVLASEQVASQSKINQEVQALLAIDASEARAKQLRSMGLRVSSIPRRRQDPDMIFIATNPALARQVKPLLNFYFAGKLPAYASSSVFSGRIQPGVDQDLNGIKFCDMPWILDPSIRASGSYKAVSGNYSLSADQTARLYALGLDAYKVAVQIDQLTKMPELGIRGTTGTLTIDQQQNVQRSLMWASFRKGYPHVEANY